jgi:riboflavin kinase/FMN adenylyltransferase
MRTGVLTAVTIGKFDGFHRGHRLLLEKLKAFSEQGLTPIVIRIRFPGEMILSEEEDLEILSEYGSPELVTIPFTEEFAGKSPEEFVREILYDRYKAREIVVGRDFRFGNERSGDVRTLSSLGEKYGFNVTTVEKLVASGETVSSSRIRGLIKEGNIEEAESLLGHPIKLTDEVRHGKELGRTLGFPTINQIPSDDRILPRFGVYRSEVSFDGEIYTGLTNLGLRPTVENAVTPVMETYIVGFSGDLYGKTVTVKLVHFIRPEVHFNSVNELKNQMMKDLEKAAG